MLSDEIHYHADRVHVAEDTLQRVKEWSSRGGQPEAEANASLMKIHNLVLLTLSILAKNDPVKEEEEEKDA